MKWLTNVALLLLLLFIPGLNAVEGEKLLFILRNKVQTYDITWQNRTTVTDYLADIVEIDYDFETQTIFYVIDRKTIYSMNLITKGVKVVVKPSSANFQQISIDWILKKLYFTDEETKRIEVCNFDGSFRHVLFTGNIGHLKGITVSPKHGMVFFTDQGDNPKVEQAGMDGSNRRILANTDMHMPASVVVDPETDRVYWSDVYKATVEMIFINRTGRQVLFHSEHYVFSHVFGMTIAGSRLYFLDHSLSHISSCDKLNGTLSLFKKSIIKGSGIYSMKAFGAMFQPFFNSQCHIKNGGCSHLCLLKPQHGYSCACPTGLKLNSDGKTCSSFMEKFVILASRPDIRVFSLDTKYRVGIKIPLTGLKIVMDVDYDSVDQMLYWTDSGMNSYGVIKRATLDGSVIETVVPVGYTQPDHLVIDWIARNLYWTCPRFNKIYVSRLNGSWSTVIIDTDLERPRGIAVDPGDGRLYWSDWGGKPKIEVSDLDGTNRLVLVDKDLRWPNGIALDFLRRHLYWVDGGKDRIEFYDLVHKTRHQMEASSHHMFGISVVGDYVYWTDWQKRSLFEFNLVTRGKVVTAADVPDIMGVKAIDTTLMYGANDCQYNKHGCSHFCFHKPNIGAVCACPDGYKLDSFNKRKCIALTGYLLYSTRTYINSLSLARSNNIPAVPKILDTEITHLATYSKYGIVFWVENMEDGHMTKAIKSASLNDTSKVTIVQTGFLGPVGGIVIDWISENIYWSQQHSNQIEVSKLDGRFRRILIQRKYKRGSLVRMSLMSVNPLERKLYWIEVHGLTISSVYSLLHVSNLDGSSQKILTNITGETNGLTIDLSDGRVYWVAKNTDSIESINSNGRNRYVVAKSLGTPIGLTIYRDNLYFCEQETKHAVSSSVSSVSKYNGTNYNHIAIKSNAENGWCQDIVAAHSSLQTGENICDRHNGGCEHLCFATSLINRTCSCEMHYNLDENNSTCTGPNIFMLLTAESVIYRVISPYVPALPLHFNVPIFATHIEYNIKTETIYWIDSQAKKIFYALDGNVIPLDLRSVDGREMKPSSFVIDFFTNCLYWIGEENKKIYFINLNDHNKNGVIFSKEGYNPWKLAILPEKGLLFFSNEHNSETEGGFDSIEVIHLDGSNQKRLQKFETRRLPHSRYDIETDKILPHSRYDLAVDHSKERLYWLHKTAKRIESVNLEGRDQQIQIRMSKYFTPIAIDVHEKYLYWVDLDIKNRIEKIKRCHLQKSMGKEILHYPRIYENTNDLLIVNINRKKRNHPCKVKNGGCSHICFVNGSLKAQCGCPQGYVYKTGSRATCEKRNPDTCVFVCDNECKPSSVRCDGRIECGDGSDELDCPCKTDEFRCSSGKCMKQTLRCNGIRDCENGEDENILMCHLITGNTTTSTSQPVATITINARSINDYSKYTAGIISGAILTVLLLVCVLYIVCRLHPKKHLRPEDNTLLQKVRCKFEVGTESVYVLPSNGRLVQENVLSESPTRLSCQMYNTLPRLTRDAFDFRYITGSSANLTDSVALPFNPPPSVMSLESLKLNSDSSCEKDDNFNTGYYEEREIPAPPATPLYFPSDNDSILAYQTDDTDQPYLRHKLSCSHCRLEKTYSRDLCECSSRVSYSRPAQSLASSYIATKRRPLYLRKANSHRSLDSLHGQTVDGQYLTADTINNRDRRLMPSLASESICSSEISIATVREYKGNYFSESNNCYNTYAPPPSPGTEYASDINDFKLYRDSGKESPSDMNDFKQYKDDDDDEEYDVDDFLLDSHRHDASSASSSASELF